MITAQRFGDYVRVVAWVLWACTALVCIYSEIRVTQIIRDVVSRQAAQP